MFNDVLPNWSVLLFFTIAPAPIAVALNKLTESASADHPINVFLVPVVFLKPALYPNAAFESAKLLNRD